MRSIRLNKRIKRKKSKIDKLYNELVSIFDSIDEVIYVTDPESYEILYVNAALCKSLKKSKSSIIGRKCYRVFQGMTEPCPFCSNEQIFGKNLGKTYIWEFQNRLNKRWYRCIDRAIRWSDGRFVRYEMAIDITESKTIEEILRESEQRYRKLFEKSPMAITILDSNGVIIECNDATVALTGYSKNELIGSKITDLPTIKPDEIPQILEKFKMMQETKELEDDEIEFMRKDGTKKWIRVNGSAILGKEGILGFQIITQDITDIKSFERSIRESEETFRNLAEYSPNMIFINHKGRVVYANKRCEELLGYKKEEFYAENFDFLVLISPQYHDLVKQNFARHLEGKDIPPYEYELISKDGKRLRAIITTKLIDYKGEQAILGIITDITNYIRTFEALKESETKYKTLTENLNVGIYRNSGLDGDFIEVNPAMLKIFGYDKKEDIQNLKAIDLYLNPDDRDRFNEKMRRDGFVKNLELPLKRKDGSVFYASVSAVAVKNKEGNIQYYDGMIEDITERKLAQKKLEESYQKLRLILDGTVNALSSTTKIKDPYTAGHQQRVTQLAIAIAKEMGLPDERIEGLRVAGIVHDLGKIQVASEILNKPIKLSDIEMALIKEHPHAGYEILKNIEFPWPVAQIVLQHHERIDGSGYPSGLKGEEILLEAKILAVADIVEAMSAHRPYRAPIAVPTVLNYLAEQKGKTLDSLVVDACLTVFKKGFEFK
ncbi:MAG: PAS domain S-box protein [candidate division WOR-3 bacterium]